MSLHQGLTIHQINAQVDNVLRLSRRRQWTSSIAIDSKGEPVLAPGFEAWNVLVDARLHLANGPMPPADVEAYQTMGWLQKRLMSDDTTGVCQIPMRVNEQELVVCGKPATFCGDCGGEICSEHAVRCCSETRCQFCTDVHREKHHAWLLAQPEFQS